MRILWIILCMSVGVWAWQFMGFGTDTQEKKVELRTVLPMDVDYEKIQAQSYLNTIRDAMQLNTLLHNDLLTKAAQSHADYLVLNKELSHYQTVGKKNFTGIKPVDRTLYANYPSSHVSENLSTHTYSAQYSIDALFSAIYHRFGFLSLTIDEIGVGVTQDKAQASNTAFVYVMGNSALKRLCGDKSFTGRGKYYYKICKDEKHRISEKDFIAAQNSNKKYNPKIVFYPYDGQIEVPPVFYDESPDPLPHHEVSGFPVSVEFNDYYFDEVELLSFKLFEHNGKEINHILLMNKENDPHQRFSDKQFTLFPLKRLEYDMQYQASIIYRIKDKTHTYYWTFRTQNPKGELHRIEKKNVSIRLTKGQSHVLYFPPENAHDLFKTIQFPEDVDIYFIDHNTLSLTVMDDNLDDFTIQNKNRKVHIIME